MHMESPHPDTHESDLYLLAKRFGFASAIPERNTEGYQRLRDTLLTFARTIEFGMASRTERPSSWYGLKEKGRAATDDILGTVAKREVSETTDSERRRRELHDELCRMVFGTSWEETKPHRRDQITEFALQLRDLENPPREEAA